MAWRRTNDLHKHDPIKSTKKANVHASFRLDIAQIGNEQAIQGKDMDTVDTLCVWERSYIKLCEWKSDAPPTESQWRAGSRQWPGMEAADQRSCISQIHQRQAQQQSWQTIQGPFCAETKIPLTRGMQGQRIHWGESLKCDQDVFSFLLDSVWRFGLSGWSANPGQPRAASTRVSCEFKNLTWCLTKV